MSDGWVAYLGGHGGRVKIGVTLFGTFIKNLVDFIFEIQFKQFVGFIQHQILQMFQSESFRIF